MCWPDILLGILPGTFLAGTTLGLLVTLALVRRPYAALVAQVDALQALRAVQTEQLVLARWRAAIISTPTIPALDALQSPGVESVV